MVRVSLANAFNVDCRAPVFDGKKPSKVNLSVGKPATESAAIAAQAPGIGETLNPCWRQ